MTGPIIFQEPRQRTVGEYPPACLTARAVVGFVVGVADPLHRGSADGTRLAEPAVDGHAGTKRGDLLGEIVAGLGSKPVGPLLEDSRHRLAQAFDLVVRQLRGQRQWRQSGAMEDLVGIGVADAAEESAGR